MKAEGHIELALGHLSAMEKGGSLEDGGSDNPAVDFRLPVKCLRSRTKSDSSPLDGCGEWPEENSHISSSE